MSSGLEMDVTLNVFFTSLYSSWEHCCAGTNKNPNGVVAFLKSLYFSRLQYAPILRNISASNAQAITYPVSMP